MTVENFTKLSGFEVVAMPNPENEINGAYVGDLLSWVMGRAGEGSVWITIMTNLNVVAVASLSDVSCVLLSEGVTPDAEVIRVASEKGVNILSSPLPSYESALKVYEALK